MDVFRIPIPDWLQSIPEWLRGVVQDSINKIYWAGFRDGVIMALLVVLVFVVAVLSVRSTYHVQR